MIKPLTSLRFFFALMVLLNHVPFPYNHIIYKMASNGSVGVSFFFILSGFILSYNYQKKFSKNYNKKKFWIDRFLRIYPLHLFILCLISFLFLFLGTNYILIIKQFFSHLFLVQNYIPIKEIYSSLNKPAWSICCEIFFYFIFPFIILRIKKNSIYFILLLIAFAFFLYYFNSQNSMFIGINPFIRLSDFIVGILTFQLYDKLKVYFEKLNLFQYSLLELFALIILFMSLIFFSNLYYYQIFPLFWIPMVVFILTMSVSKGILARILSHHYLIILGEISYSIYMTHYLILTVLAVFFRDSFIFNNRPIFIFSFLAITIIFSYFTYKIIEIGTLKKARYYFYDLFNIKD